MTPVARIRALGGALPGYPGSAHDPEPRPGGFTASVAVLLRPGRSEPEILLIRRAEIEGDPWSGHMAFPGGRKDDSDRSLLETAVRETREETGVVLAGHEDLLGTLGTVSPLSRLLPPLAIVPFVFSVPPGVRLRPSPSEVAAAHWVPIGRFRDPNLRTTYRVEGDHPPMEFPAWRTEGGIVWGLTHRILEDLLTRMEGVRPDLPEGAAQAPRT